jgi:hypothetical protein
MVDQPTLMLNLRGKFNDLTDKFMRQGLQSTDVAVIQKAWNEVRNHPLLQGPDIPVQTAQEIKQGTYRSLGEKAYPGGNPSGGNAAEKAIARSMKEAVDNAVPEVRPLNAQESKMLNALNMIERKALTEANKHTVGFGWLTTSPVHFAAYMADRSSLFRSLVARMLNTTSEALPTMSAAGPAMGMAVSQNDPDEHRQALIEALR